MDGETRKRERYSNTNSVKNRRSRGEVAFSGNRYLAKEDRRDVCVPWPGFIAHDEVGRAETGDIVGRE